MSNKRLIDGEALIEALKYDCDLMGYRDILSAVESGRFDIPSNQGEAARQAFPRQSNNEGGWMISVKFLQTIEDAIEAQEERYDFGGLEGIQEVLLALEALSSHTEDTGPMRRICSVCKGSKVYPFDWSECRPCDGTGFVPEDTGIQKARERPEFELQLLRMWQVAGIDEVYKYKHHVKAYHERRHNTDLFYDLTNGTLFTDIKDVADAHPSIPYHDITPEDCKVSIDSLIARRIGGITIPGITDGGET